MQTLKNLLEISIYPYCPQCKHSTLNREIPTGLLLTRVYLKWYSGMHITPNY